jgi:hypothetical protein
METIAHPRRDRFPTYWQNDLPELIATNNRIVSEGLFGVKSRDFELNGWDQRKAAKSLRFYLSTIFSASLRLGVSALILAVVSILQNASRLNVVHLTLRDA